MKTIVVNWRKEDSIHGKAMFVVVSGHPRFKAGARFDYGLLSMATNEGYTIVVLPIVEGA